MAEPTITKTDTEDGWTYDADYGKEGISRATVHIPQSTPEQRASDRAALERLLTRYGYRLTTT